jgi:hypothetical protein
MRYRNWLTVFGTVVLVAACMLGAALMLIDAGNCADAGGEWFNDRGLNGSVCIRDGRVIEP